MALLKSFVCWIVSPTNKDAFTSSCLYPIYLLLWSYFSRWDFKHYIGQDWILVLFLSVYSFNTTLVVGLFYITLSVEIGFLCLSASPWVL